MLCTWDLIIFMASLYSIILFLLDVCQYITILLEKILLKMTPFFTQSSASLNYHCKTYPIMSSHVLISSVKFDLVPLCICCSRWHHHLNHVSRFVEGTNSSRFTFSQVKSPPLWKSNIRSRSFFFILLSFINRYSIPSLSLLFVKCRLYVVSDGWSLAMRPMAHFLTVCRRKCHLFFFLNRGSLAIGKMEDFF